MSDPHGDAHWILQDLAQALARLSAALQVPA